MGTSTSRSKTHGSSLTIPLCWPEIIFPLFFPPPQTSVQDNVSHFLESFTETLHQKLHVFIKMASKLPCMLLNISSFWQNTGRSQWPVALDETLGFTAAKMWKLACSPTGSTIKSSTLGVSVYHHFINSSGTFQLGWPQYLLCSVLCKIILSRNIFFQPIYTMTPSRLISRLPRFPPLLPYLCSHLLSIVPIFSYLYFPWSWMFFGVKTATAIFTTVPNKMAKSTAVLNFIPGGNSRTGSYFRGSKVVCYSDVSPGRTCM